jgi:hypothetical protein
MKVGAPRRSRAVAVFTELLSSEGSVSERSRSLKRRDIVVVDNVPFHKVGGVEEAIRAIRYVKGTIHDSSV